MIHGAACAYHRELTVVSCCMIMALRYTLTTVPTYDGEPITVLYQRNDSAQSAVSGRG